MPKALYAIGKNGPAAEALVDMLLECHGRIRAFCDLAVSLGEREDASEREVVDVCARIERYFKDALPLHVKDEEESVLPRLRGHSGAVDAALGCMHEQHETHVVLLDHLVTASAALRGRPRDAHRRRAVLAVAGPLRAVFAPHLDAEEQVIFPAVRALIPLHEQSEAVRELRARRTSEWR